MQYGKLRHTVTIQDFTTSKDAHGHVQRSWSDVATVRADVRGQYGMESAFAERIEARSIYRVVIRYRGDLKPQQRLIWKNSCDGNRTLEIQSALDMRGDRRMTTIIAIEVTT